MILQPRNLGSSSTINLIDSDQLLDQWLPLLTSDLGPVGVDTERASGFRYFQQAYLIQLKTNSSGVLLIDPVSITQVGLAKLNLALSGKQWILHSASQDLQSLRLCGLNPDQVFDTELAARILGRPRVGLGPLIEDVLSISLPKEHANSDWSQRPLPVSWLVYAADDVEFLIDLAAVLTDELEQVGKLEWAIQEFAHLVSVAPTPPKVEPWRSTTDIHLVKSRLGMAVVRQLWITRDRIAQDLDLAPHRIVNDRAISALARAVNESVPVTQLSWPDKDWNTAICREHLNEFRAGLDAAVQTKESDLPPMRIASTEITTPSRWSRLNLDADKRWKLVRPAVVALATTLKLPVEVLISPKALRGLLWEPAGVDPASIDDQLSLAGVRQWQRDLLVELIADLLSGNQLANPGD